MIDFHLYCQIRELHCKQHLSYMAIAEKLHLNQATISKWAKMERYPKVFRYFADSKAEGLKRGYVEREGMRRYFDGFGSSSIEKRNTAQVLAGRWLLQY